MHTRASHEATVSSGASRQHGFFVGQGRAGRKLKSVIEGRQVVAANRASFKAIHAFSTRTNLAGSSTVTLVSLSKYCQMFV